MKCIQSGLVALIPLLTLTCVGVGSSSAAYPGADNISSVHTDGSSMSIRHNLGFGDYQFSSPTRGVPGRRGGEGTR